MDDVLLDAPYTITKRMISSLKIQAVVRGSVQPEVRGLSVSNNLLVETATVTFGLLFIYIDFALLCCTVLCCMWLLCAG